MRKLTTANNILHTLSHTLIFQPTPTYIHAPNPISLFTISFLYSLYLTFNTAMIELTHSPLLVLVYPHYYISFGISIFYDDLFYYDSIR